MLGQGKVSLGWGKEGMLRLGESIKEFQRRTFRALLVFFTKKYVCCLYDEMKNNLWSKACNWFPRPSDDDSLNENDDSNHNDENNK